MADPSSSFWHGFDELDREHQQQRAADEQRARRRGGRGRGGRRDRNDRRGGRGRGGDDRRGGRGRGRYGDRDDRRGGRGRGRCGDRDNRHGGGRGRGRHGGGRERHAVKSFDGGGSANRLQRTLVRICRHDAQRLGCEVRSDGFIPVDEILELETMQKFGATNNEIREAVNTEEKKRLSHKIEGGRLYIRANTAHTMKIVKAEELCEKIDFPPKIYAHGSFMKNFDSIKKHGLLALQRNWIHFAHEDEPANLKGSDLLVHVNPRKATRDGIFFYKSDNGLIVTPGVDGCLPNDYITKMVNIRFLDDGSLEELDILYENSDDDDDLDEEKTFSKHPNPKEESKPSKEEDTEGLNLSDDDDDKLCSICMDSPRDTILIPCGHFFYCNVCVKDLNDCPTCRKPIALKQKVFY